MATKKDSPAEGLRRCIGSERYGIKPHDAPIEDFPAQPSQKDGLGRMCKTHWNQYTAGLARDRKAREPAPASVAETDRARADKAAAKATAKPAARARPTASAGKKVRATAKSPKKPEPIRTTAERRAARTKPKTSGETIAESMAEASTAGAWREGDAG